MRDRGRVGGRFLFIYLFIYFILSFFFLIGGGGGGGGGGHLFVMVVCWLTGTR